MDVGRWVSNPFREGIDAMKAFLLVASALIPLSVAYSEPSPVGEFGGSDDPVSVSIKPAGSGLYAIESSLVVGDCSGTIRGAGSLDGHKITFHPTTDNGALDKSCSVNLIFTPQFDGVTIDSDCGTQYHGVACGWEGDQIRKAVIPPQTEKQPETKSSEPSESDVKFADSKLDEIASEVWLAYRIKGVGGMIEVENDCWAAVATLPASARNERSSVCAAATFMGILTEAAIAYREHRGPTPAYDPGTAVDRAIAKGEAIGLTKKGVGLLIQHHHQNSAQLVAALIGAGVP
jgi:hypothetical protein